MIIARCVPPPPGGGRLTQKIKSVVPPRHPVQHLAAASPRGAADEDATSP